MQLIKGWKVVIHQHHYLHAITIVVLIMTVVSLMLFIAVLVCYANHDLLVDLVDLLSDETMALSNCCYDHGILLPEVQVDLWQKFVCDKRFHEHAQGSGSARLDILLGKPAWAAVPFSCAQQPTGTINKLHGTGEDAHILKTHTDVCNRQANAVKRCGSAVCFVTAHMRL